MGKVLVFFSERNSGIHGHQSLDHLFIHSNLLLLLLLLSLNPFDHSYTSSHLPLSSPLIFVMSPLFLHLTNGQLVITRRSKRLSSREGVRDWISLERRGKT